MADIDRIMRLLDGNNSAKKQGKGIRLARKVICINAFLQPGPPYGKAVWENCAKILSKRTNEELSPYLVELLAWLRDMNWPGAFCILDRIKRMTDVPLFRYSVEHCRKCARALDDPVWESVLVDIMGTGEDTAARGQER